MKVQTKGNFDDNDISNPRIKEDYYITELDDIIHYPREGEDARGLVFRFRVVDDDVEVLNDFDLERSDGEIILPFFAPANLSKSTGSGTSSRLTDICLESIGLHEPVLDILDQSVKVKTGEDESGEPVFDEMSLKQAVLDGKVSVKADSEDHAEEMIDALKAVLVGKQIRVGVEDSEDEETGNIESHVYKFSKVFDEEEDSEDGDDGEEVILDGDDEEE